MDRYYTTKIRPICPSCGDKLAHKENIYKKLLKTGIKPGEVLDKIGVDKFCCRTRFLSPAVIPIGNYFQKAHESEKDIKVEFKASTRGVLVSLHNFNGKEYITTVLPSEHNGVISFKPPIFETAEEVQDVISPDISYSDQSKHIEEKIRLFKMSDNISMR